MAVGIVFLWFASVLAVADDLKYFNDRLLFTISYLSNDQLSAVPVQSSLVSLKSADEENYRCLLPDLDFSNDDRVQSYSGPSPAKLVDFLYKSKECSLRIESFWIYELCHGQKLRQFHEDKTTKRVLEYNLGIYQHSPWDQVTDKFDQLDPPKVEFNGQQVASFPVTYRNGTTCDLTGKPRSTTVFYICNEISLALLSMSEVRSCEYEAIVATNHLCLHPAFRPPKVSQLEIRCFAATPEVNARPVGYDQFENDHHDFDDFSSVLERRAGIQRKPANLIEDLNKLPNLRSSLPAAVKMLTEQGRTSHNSLLKLVDDFFHGKQCLHGFVPVDHDSKVEICYKKHVVKYHEDNKTGKRTKTVLGRYSEKNQRNWAKLNPKRSKRYDEEEIIKEVVNFYGHGEVCETTGKPRVVETRLTCSLGKDMVETLSLKTYLVELNPCEYVVVVESGLLCSYLEKTTEHGIYKQESILDYMPLLLDALKDVETNGDFVVIKKEFVTTDEEMDDAAESAPKKPRTTQQVNYHRIQP